MSCVKFCLCDFSSKAVYMIESMEMEKMKSLIFPMNSSFMKAIIFSHGKMVLKMLWKYDYSVFRFC